MFIKALSGVTDGSVDAFKYTDVIDLTQKRYDGKRLSLKLDLTNIAATGTLDVVCLISAKSDGVYTTFTTGSGTTLLLSGATYTSGGTGSYYTPITIIANSGTTRWLEAVPFVKFGFRALTFNVPFEAWLCVG